MTQAQPQRAHERAPETGIHTRNGAGTLLDADDLAARWKVPKTQVWRLARTGRLATVSIGRYKRWRICDVERFEQEGGVDA